VDEDASLNAASSLSKQDSVHPHPTR